MVGVHKRFPGTHAVRGVDFALRAGEIHGLVGENGAGKSTLMRMLAGVLRPDAGRIEIAGRPLPPGSPALARRAGIAALAQEPSVVPGLSAIANVFLGQTLSRAGFRSERRMALRFAELAAELGLSVDGRAPAGSLGPGAQKGVEIMRALQQGARVIVLDEPTASLPPADREALFRAMRLLRDRGASLVFISHHLDEVLALADAVTVLRDGAVVHETAAGDTTTDRLVQAMLGHALEDEIEEEKLEARLHDVVGAEEVIAVDGLTVPGILHGVSLRVRRGDIVGVAGLVGSGRTTLLRALAGAEPAARGLLRVQGAPARWPRSPAEALRLGIALAPEDRRRQGLVLSLTAGENIVLSRLGAAARGGLVRRSLVLEQAGEQADTVHFDRARLRAPARVLSGGNQQKVVLARALRRRPDVLLVDEPMRGIDVGAKAEIFRVLRALADDGTAIVMVSEEIEEVLALASRVVVLARGTVTATLDGPEADERAVLAAMFRFDRESAA